MAHSSTVLAQMLKLLPGHEFETLAREHHQGRKLRRISRWAQFVAMASAQLTGRASLHDLLGNLAAQPQRCITSGWNRYAAAASTQKRFSGNVF